WTEQHHAGIVYERVEPAQLRYRALDGGLRLALLRHIGLDNERADAVPTDFLSQLIEPFLTPRGERHRRALRGQHASGRGANTATCPRDERDCSIESFWHRTCPPCGPMIWISLRSLSSAPTHA